MPFFIYGKYYEKEGRVMMPLSVRVHHSFVDGMAARKLNTKSEFGSKLDSIADFAFILVIIVKIILYIEIPAEFIGLILITAAIRCTSYLIGYFKFKEFISIHTYLNKLTGVVLFISPLILYVFERKCTLIFMAFLAFFSAIEEFLIIIKLKKIKRDIKSIIKFK